MGFEFIQTIGYTWGYVFVIVIAGLALLVGKKKRDKKKKQVEESNRIDTIEKQSKPEEPELEQVDTQNSDDKKTDDQEKTEN